MRLHCFIGRFNMDQREVEIADPQLVHQMTKVLRFKKGDSFILGDGQGKEGVGKIIRMTSSKIVARLDKKPDFKKESVPEITLYLAGLKKENFEWVAQKATEIGISELIPIETVRVVKQNVNRERVEKIMREAVEQSGRKKVPVLFLGMTLEKALERSRAGTLRLFFDQGGKPLSQMGHTAERIALFVGPEGGWTEEEKKEAEKAGVEVVSLSPFTLRAETAAIVAVFEATKVAAKKKPLS